MARTQEFYAPELKRNVVCRGLSVAGVLRVDMVIRDIKSERARNMAQILETIRDGLVVPAQPTNAKLMAFAEKYPDLTARIYSVITELTTQT